VSEKQIASANTRLKSAKTGITIESKGDRLTLRATLPPKLNSGRDKPYQQRIYLGWYANPAGIKRAEAEAHLISEKLSKDKFTWSDYLETEVEQVQVVSLPLVSELVEKFKADKLAQGISDRTWKDDYEAVFKCLAQDVAISSERMVELARTTKPNTRTRRRFCLAFSMLAKFANIEIDLSQYIGNYSPTKVQPRNIPSDELIQQWYEKIPNSSWQWAYGIMATYGLRPSELAYLDFEELPILNIMKGKTGERRVWAIFPEWVEKFNLKNINLPPVQDFGEQTCKQFARYDVPFDPYDLRHAWAIRSMEFGLPIELAAQQMGHSMVIHSRTYHRWISDRHHQRAYEMIMMRKDRPLPPS
jgi:integrase